MHRFLLVATLVSAAACTTETDTGQLVRLHDQVFANCEDGPGSTCNLFVDFSEGQFTASGLYKDGTTQGPTAVGTLTEGARAHLADLIAQIPLESDETVHAEGCGGPPERATGADISFDHDGLRHFNIESAYSGPWFDVDSYLNQLVLGVRTCNSTELTFDNCDPNVF
jgi:hypothetical protein